MHEQCALFMHGEHAKVMHSMFNNVIQRDYLLKHLFLNPSDLGQIDFCAFLRKIVPQNVLAKYFFIIPKL